MRYGLSNPEWWTMTALKLKEKVGAGHLQTRQRMAHGWHMGREGVTWDAVWELMLKRWIWVQKGHVHHHRCETETAATGPHLGAKEKTHHPVTCIE